MSWMMYEYSPIKYLKYYIAIKSYPQQNDQISSLFFKFCGIILCLNDF